MIGSIMVALLTALAFGEAEGQHAPAVPSPMGSERRVAASEPEALLAITNAFKGFRYRGMALYEAARFPWDDLARGWHPTNGFQLLSSHEPIGSAPLSRQKEKQVPYIAYFYIVTKPLATNQTLVNVRTTLSEVIDGKEPGIHARWVNHYRKVSPVRQEEVNVLDAIEAELTKPQTNAVSLGVPPQAQH